MRALLLDRPGSPDTLYVSELPEPQPTAGQVRVKVHAAGLNPADYKFAQRGFARWSYPHIPGMDVAGVIDEIGADVTQWQVGDAVYYHGDLSQPGAFAEWTIAQPHAIAPLPQGVSFTEAAALPCAGFTAYQALHHKLHIAAGQTILVQAGAGGVGGFAVQLAALAGLKVISTCSMANFDWVRQLGASDVLDYHTQDVAAEVQKLTDGRGVDAIVDTVNADTATLGLDLLAFGGGIACVAALPNFNHFQSFGKALSVHDIALGGAYLSGDRPAQEQLAQIGRDLGQLVSDRKINPMLHEVIGLEEIPDGLTRLSQRHIRGKIVAQIQQP
ncbi:MAG: zinc-binding dehydrogenase [Leptolyngbyaceae cyanobacterium bins.302]|nr:zinc-binding dehydrogenase [Leptolyngbyaceae cyanobacterium bins.302]